MEGRPTTESLFRRTFSVLGTGFGAFLPLALVVQAPAFAYGLLFPMMAGRLTAKGDGQVAALFAFVGGAIFISFLVLLLTTLASAVMIYGVFQVLRGAPLRIGECVQVVAGRWPSVVGLAILVGLTVGIGYLLLLVPGIIASCGLFVAVPVLLVERLGATDSMRRSWSLTDGYKGVIFFVFLGIGVFQLGFSQGLEWLLTSSPLDAAVRLALSTVVSYGVNSVATAFHAVAAGVAYHDLRVFSEGLGEDELVAVFD